jgi:uncharacterized protein YvpB
MTTPTTALTALAAKRPAQAPKPRPSRTDYRPAKTPPTFKDALQSATGATLAQSYASPSAAQIAAPPADPGSTDASADGSQASPMPPLASNPTSSNPMLWESLLRGPSLPLTPNMTDASATDTGTVTAMSAQTSAPDATAQSLSPAALKDQGQAFLKSIKGFDQTSASEYDSPSQAQAWGYSTCSAASLAAVLRAAGQNVKVADVMKAMPNGITIKLGLVSRPSLVNAANQFGAKATDDVTSYEGLDQATANGQPVLVDVRNGRFPEGHWMVVTGVDQNNVQVADSSRYDLKSIPRGEFLRSWSGRGVRLEGLSAPTAQAGANTQAA